MSTPNSTSTYSGSSNAGTPANKAGTADQAQTAATDHSLNENPVEPNAPRTVGRNASKNAGGTDADGPPKDTDTTKLSQDGGTPGM
jgi:hypothetical protein